MSKKLTIEMKDFLNQYIGKDLIVCVNAFKSKFNLTDDEVYELYSEWRK